MAIGVPTQVATVDDARHPAEPPRPPDQSSVSPSAQPMAAAASMPAAVEMVVGAQLICCPVDHGALVVGADKYRCVSCGADFPVVSGRPVLIDERRSLFRNQTIAAHSDRHQAAATRGWKARLRHLLPVAGSVRTLADLSRVVPHLPNRPRILVIGCGFTRASYQQAFPGSRLLLTDITLQGDADLACDGQCLPFHDGSFDLIVADQVLEHVYDATAVVGEMERCLKPGGSVYSGVPFFFPDHAAPYDFRRFTPIGHRCLFPRFRTLYFATSGGPIAGASLALNGAAASLSSNMWWRRGVSMAVRLGVRPFALLDRARPPARTTVALGTIFIGQKDGRARSFEEMCADLGLGDVA
jgi:SAM-dependent methyltransferase